MVRHDNYLWWTLRLKLLAYWAASSTASPASSTASPASSPASSIVLARSERGGENREQDGEQSQTQQNVAEQGTPPYLFS